MAGFKQDLPIVFGDDSSVEEYFTNALKGDLKLLFGVLLLGLSIALLPFVPVLMPVFLMYFLVKYLIESGFFENEFFELIGLILLYIGLILLYGIICVSLQALYWGALPFTYWPIFVFMVIFLPEQCTTEEPNYSGYFLNPLLGPIYCLLK